MKIACYDLCRGIKYTFLLYGNQHLFWFFGHGRRNVLNEVLHSLFMRGLAEQTASCKPSKLGLMSIGVKSIRTVIFSPIRIYLG
jgi:hypothetical protein